ncbi:MAG TPA: type II toxin-antitoxin system Phd/YefM family antitoxin [Candidatus Methylacidiphilales bacterium]|jgi:prevent-host-death family protein|nr:type II toxin-antitoxin system Phd/YefM family antitoxin [Candidatus Methylacidiphilales bacterium]
MVETELVTSLKRNATKILSNVQKKKRPVLITHRGLPAAYLVDAKSFDLFQRRMEILEGLARGEEDFRAGRVLTQDQVEKKMARWLK